MCIFNYCLVIYGVLKKRKCCNRKIEKNNSPFNECPCFVCLTTQNKHKKFPSVCLAIYLCVPFECTITIAGVSASKQNLVGVFYV